MLIPPESSVIIVDDGNQLSAPPPPEDDASNTAMDTAVGSIADADSIPSDTEERRSNAPQPPSNFNRPVANDDSDDELRRDQMRASTIDLIIQNMPDRLNRDTEWSMRETLKQMTRGQLKAFHAIVLSWKIRMEFTQVR